MFSFVFGMGTVSELVEFHSKASCMLREKYSCQNGGVGGGGGRERCVVMKTHQCMYPHPPPCTHSLLISETTPPPPPPNLLHFCTRHPLCTCSGLFQREPPTPSPFYILTNPLHPHLCFRDNATPLAHPCFYIFTTTHHPPPPPPTPGLVCFRDNAPLAHPCFTFSLPSPQPQGLLVSETMPLWPTLFLNIFNSVTASPSPFFPACSSFQPCLGRQFPCLQLQVVEELSPSLTQFNTV